MPRWLLQLNLPGPGAEPRSERRRVRPAGSESIEGSADARTAMASQPLGPRGPAALSPVSAAASQCGEDQVGGKCGGSVSGQFVSGSSPFSPPPDGSRLWWSRTFPLIGSGWWEADISEAGRRPRPEERPKTRAELPREAQPVAARCWCARGAAIGRRRAARRGPLRKRLETGCRGRSWQWLAWRPRLPTAPGCPHPGRGSTRSFAVLLGVDASGSPRQPRPACPEEIPTRPAVGGLAQWYRAHGPSAPAGPGPA